MANLLLKAGEVERYLAGGSMRIVLPLQPQPEFKVSGIGPVFEYRPTKARLFATQAPKKAERLRDFDRYAPFQPGDTVTIREPWFLVSRNPNGSVTIRYDGGEERTLTPPEGTTVRVQWAGRWQGARSMYLWMCRFCVHILTAECRKVGGVWSWVYDSKIERIEG